MSRIQDLKNENLYFLVYGEDES